jgi:peptidoglycan/xylan/chitin deacetylase (PgdA/CDA1 family)
MGFYWVKTNRFIKWIFPKYVWDIPNSGKKVFLTFDDGPTPEVTQWALSQLQQFNAKATFFCIGNNIESHPDIFKKVLDDGHAIGNHTFNHLNGWQHDNRKYLENVRQCADSINKLTVETKLFRPPYGKVKKSQAKILRESGYEIVMWDILSADFDHSITPEQCLNHVIKNIESGSVVIFHDSVKGFKNLEYVLPKTLAFLKENGYECAAIA